MDTNSISSHSLLDRNINMKKSKSENIDSEDHKMLPQQPLTKETLREKADNMQRKGIYV